MNALAVLLVAASLGAPPEKPSESQLRDLVKQLGDKSYHKRSAAAHALLQGGSASVEVLREGIWNVDIEISERCRALLPAAASLERNEKLNRLTSNPTGPLPEGLAGLQRFISITGDTKEAREMYAEMLALHHDIVEKVETNPKEGGAMLVRFCDETYARWQAGANAGRYTYETVLQNRGEMALFFFAASEPKLPRNVGAGLNKAQYILFSPRIPVALAEGGTESSPAFRKLFLAWLEVETTNYLQSRGFQLAATAKMKEVVPLAKKMLANKGMNGYQHGQIITTLASLGDKEIIKDLEPFVTDKSVVTTVNFGGVGANAGQRTVQTGDVALAAIIHLNGLNPSDFGYDTRLRMMNNQSAYIYCGFLSDKDRDDARAKWKEHVEKNSGKK